MISYVRFEHLAEITEKEFRAVLRHSLVTRSCYEGLLRNVGILMGNSAR